MAVGRLVPCDGVCRPPYRWDGLLHDLLRHPCYRDRRETMTDPQRRAVEALTKIGVNWEEVDEEQANYAIEQEAGDV